LKGEGLTMELTRECTDYIMIMKTVIAFANTEGGVLGIEAC
jgi:hypothetical protein